MITFLQTKFHKDLGLCISNKAAERKQISEHSDHHKYYLQMDTNTIFRSTTIFYSNQHKYYILIGKTIIFRSTQIIYSDRHKYHIQKALFPSSNCRICIPTILRYFAFSFGALLGQRKEKIVQFVLRRN